MVSEIGKLIDGYINRHKYPPTASEIARQVGVSRSTVSHWYRDSVPKPAHLRRLSQVIETPYSRLIDALLMDQGYYERSGEHGGADTAAKSEARDDAGLSVEQWDRRAAPLREAGYTERAIVDALGGPRPGEVGENLGGAGHIDAGHRPVDRRRRRSS